ncbi:MAG TPA: hypothetical protein VHD62_03445 [Opitutaceae bacterium]|nr:hypothetical protein [Opitutaceae bacterium]
MISVSLRFVAVASFSVALAAAGFAADAAKGELPILAKARARIGTDATLDGVKSIHYVGTLITNDANDPKKQVHATIEMIFQKPDQQCITANYDKNEKGEKLEETTALDAYEAWTRVRDLNDPKKWRFTLFDAEQIKRLRANTWETLHFFRGLERLGGRVEDKGVANVDGVTCQKVAFVHDDKMTFYRYFEVATGRLVLTETESGATLREQGEIVVSGIRFPRSLITTTKLGDQTRTVTLNYEKITVNEQFPASWFAVPPLSRN